MLSESSRQVLPITTEIHFHCRKATFLPKLIWWNIPTEPNNNETVTPQALSSALLF
jgi:hypothetical protein